MSETTKKLDAAISILISENRRDLIDLLRDVYAELVANGNPCAKIFDHKYLNSMCVDSGCQTLVLNGRIDDLEAKVLALTAERDQLQARIDELTKLRPMWLSPIDGTRVLLLLNNSALNENRWEPWRTWPGGPYLESWVTALGWVPLPPIPGEEGK